jgi:hypothetical protein
MGFLEQDDSLWDKLYIIEYKKLPSVFEGHKLNYNYKKRERENNVHHMIYISLSNLNKYEVQ